MNNCDGNEKIPRVLLVGPSLIGAGAEKHFCLIAQHLFAGSAAIAVFQAPEQEVRGTIQHSIHLGWDRLKSYPKMIWKLRNFIKSNGFDAVFAFGFYPNVVAFISMRMMRKRPALVLGEINSPWQESLETRGTVRQPINDFFRRFIYHRADCFAANSQDGVSEAIRFFGADSKRSRRIPNLVEPKRISKLAEGNETRNVNPAELSICIASRLFKRKRVDTLLKAAAALPQDMRWKIDVIGDGPDRQLLEEMAADLNIGGRVLFHGWLKNPYPIIARATVSVLCSEFEGFSNSILEAMALRVPVVTSLCTSDAKSMCDQGAALGFEVGDHMALRDQLVKISTDEKIRKTLTTNSWALVRRHMVPGAIGEYETLIKDAINIHEAKR